MRRIRQTGKASRWHLRRERHWKKRGIFASMLEGRSLGCQFTFTAVAKMKEKSSWGVGEAVWWIG